MKIFFAGVPGGNQAERERGLVRIGIKRRLITFFYEKKGEITLRNFGRVVHCKKELYDVFIGRPSKWGNPFTIGPDGTREEVVQKYEEHARKNAFIMAHLWELERKILGCWCAPALCHGDILIKLLEEGRKQNGNVSG